MGRESTALVPPRKEAMAMMPGSRPDTRIHEGTISIDLHLPEAVDDASMRFAVGDEVLFGHEGGRRPIDPFYLLLGLGVNWPALFAETVPALDGSDSTTQAERLDALHRCRMGEDGPETSTDLSGWLRRHDLGLMQGGMYGEPLYVSKDLVSDGERTRRVGKKSLRKAVEELGCRLAAQLGGDGGGPLLPSERQHLARALQAWEGRDRVVHAHHREWLWLVPKDTIRIAARMVGTMARRTKDELIGRLQGHEPPRSDQLAALDELRSELLADLGGETPYEQGYEAAGRLRSRWGLARDDPMSDLEHCVRGLSIRVGEWKDDHSTSFMGAALFHDGRAHVIIDASKSRGSVNFTLLHELAHVVFDWQDTFLAADTVRPADARNVWMEARANAFAAEALLPRKVALEQTGRCASWAAFQRRVQDLSQRFCITPNSVFLQVRNAPSSHMILQPGINAKLTEKTDRLKSQSPRK